RRLLLEVAGAGAAGGQKTAQPLAGLMKIANYRDAKRCNGGLRLPAFGAQRAPLQRKLSL
ncbi:MAG: hypothetical protein ACRD2O_04910, partial [Terriglobia bacterium]